MKVIAAFPVFSAPSISRIPNLAAQISIYLPTPGKANVFYYQGNLKMVDRRDLYVDLSEVKYRNEGIIYLLTDTTESYSQYMLLDSESRNQIRFTETL